MAASSEFVTTSPLLAKAEDLLSGERVEEAAATVIEHLRRNPDHARGYSMLGSIAMRMGALAQSEQFLRKAMSLGDASEDTQRALSSNLSQQERLPETLELLDRLEAKSSDPAILGIKAQILDRMGRNEEALQIFERLIGLVPAQAMAWISYGHCLRYAGRTDDAIAAFRKAIAIDDELGEAWWGLAGIKKKVLADDDLTSMERALAIAIDSRNLAPLHFSLARGWHDRKQYERAFHHYTEGNRIRAETYGYQTHELTEEVNEYVRFYDRSIFKRSAESPGSTPIPIFIVSLPRSGSTLLEQMLGSHPEIAPAGELAFIPALIRTMLERHTRRGPVTVPQAIMQMSDEEAEVYGEDYLRRAARHYPEGAAAFIDKLPHNWSNILFIRRILPQAKFIDIRRSAMDCCFSNFTQSFSRAHAASFALADIGQCYVDYVRLMDHLDQVAPGLVHHVRYERLIEDPEPELRALFAYLGIEWDDGPLNFHQLERVVRTPSAEQVRRPLNREGVAVWKPYEQWLGPLRDKLGPLAGA